MKETEILKMSISTLNTVEVKGEENLGAVLGVINALKTVVKAMEQPVEPPAQESQEVEDG